VLLLCVICGASNPKGVLVPELPEVETIRKGIKEKLVGKTIKNIEVKVPKLFIGDKNNIIGAKIIDAQRVAKVLIINLDNNYSIIIHLKMSGQLIYKSGTSSKLQDESDEAQIAKGGHSQKVYDQPLPHAYTHIIYTFSDGSHLYFNDFRKFGWNKIATSEQVGKLASEYGPEPIQKDFTIDYLKTIFSKTSKPVKIVLMDQAKISGIGNIYANDALWWAGILPNRPAKSLSDDEIAKLKTAIEKVIKLGIEHGGSSENTYVKLDGSKGSYMKVTAVYQKKQDPRGHNIVRSKIGGRGTFYCPVCQK
jgi:formamidopyrimidine-DNA glycosylase